jgi:hypothetical protein
VSVQAETALSIGLMNSSLCSALTEGKGKLSVDTEVILYGVLDVVSVVAIIGATHIGG